MGSGTTACGRITRPATVPPAVLQATTVLTSSLAAPVLLPVLNTELDGVYVLNWTEVISATGYLVEQSSDPYFSAPGVVYSGTLTTLPVVEQPPGEWHYRVRARAGEARSPWSGSRAVRVEGARDAAVPGALSAFDWKSNIGGQTCWKQVVKN